jgi:hypothetical protein
MIPQEARRRKPSRQLTGSPNERAINWIRASLAIALMRLSSGATTRDKWREAFSARSAAA